MSVNKDDVKFYIFSANTTEDGIKVNNVSSHMNQYSNEINPDLPTKIMIHGWLDDRKSYWYKPAVKEYLNKGDVNIITVNWAKHSKGLYTFSVKSVKAVGYHVGQLIIGIADTFGVPYENFHLIGHSLGAHISGFAGKTVINERNAKIGRITGLDPALPYFGKNAPEDRLCSNDATFIDIIHTDGGVLGFEKSLGHIDFYPNGGKRKQNGCASLDVSCSHKRAPIYFYESINSLDFVAIQAPSFTEFDCGRCVDNQRAIMGEHVDRTMMGDFYLYTNKESPFAKGPI